MLYLVFWNIVTDLLYLEMSDDLDDEADLDVTRVEWRRICTSSAVRGFSLRKMLALRTSKDGTEKVGNVVSPWRDILKDVTSQVVVSIFREFCRHSFPPTQGPCRV